MYLTAEQIKNLAEYAGFEVSHDMDASDLEAEFNVSQSKDGIKVGNDNGSYDLYDAVVSCEGCEGNECVPLSEPINK